jgi:HlyD family secretion protein
MSTTASSASNLTQRPAVSPRKKKSRKKLYIIVGIVLIVVFGMVAKGMNKGRDKVVRVTTEKAIVKTITQIVSATGKIQPETEVKMQPEVTGEIVELPFREGAEVKKGDMVISIKPDNYRYIVDQREADLASARAAAVDSRVRFEKAEADYKRTETLFARHLISESLYAADKATYEGAQANYDSAQANIRRAEGLLKQAKDTLEKTTLYAPIDGTVTSRASEVGERVAATGSYGGTIVMSIADLTNMEVRVNINENDIVNVKVGDKARVSIDAFPGRKFDAEVKEIGSAAKVTGQNTQEEVTNFQVKIRILEKDVPLRPGMSANADIETKTVENVVAVPVQSVVVRARGSNKTSEQLAKEREAKAEETKGSSGATAVNEKEKKQNERNDRSGLQRVVFVKTGGTVKMVPVETGIADTTHFEIKSGLAAGDEVVSGSYAVLTRTLADGMKVEMEQPKAGGAGFSAK